jgi:D-serine deaminase-like pyridoxal phosphate-dependent protein
MKIRDVPTPALVFDAEVMTANVSRMAECAKSAGVGLRPHAKTHKCPFIAQKQIEAGAIGITVAKLGEAEVMALAGIRDILIANQVVTPAKITRLAKLQGKARVTVAVEDDAVVKLTGEIAHAHGVRMPIVIEVDIGMNRAGVSPENVVAKALEWAENPSLLMRGVMGYEGHCVFIEDPEERRRKTTEAVERLVRAADGLTKAGLSAEIVSAGGTGTYDVTSKVKGVTEIQPGSYVLMDGRYTKLHPEFKQAAFVLSTVTSVKGGYVLADAGVKSQTSDFGLPQLAGLDGATTTKLNEEHARIELSDARTKLRAGDQVRFIPSHVCTTVNLFDRAYLMSKDEVVGVVPIAARGRSD